MLMWWFFFFILNCMSNMFYLVVVSEHLTLIEDKDMKNCMFPRENMLLMLLHRWGAGTQGCSAKAKIWTQGFTHLKLVLKQAIFLGGCKVDFCLMHSCEYWGKGFCWFCLFQHLFLLPDSRYQTIFERKRSSQQSGGASAATALLRDCGAPSRLLEQANKCEHELRFVLNKTLRGR